MKFSRRSYLMGAALLILALAVYSAAAWVNTLNTVTLPAGTEIRVSLNHAVTSDQFAAGEEFRATVSQPIVVDEETVIPAGAQAKGVLVSARDSGRLKGVARLSLQLTDVQVGEEWQAVETGTVTRTGPNHKKNNWLWIGGGAGTGTLIGAIAAGGKGALIGGPFGAGAGVVAAAITGKKDIKLAAERQVTFTLTEPVAVKPAS